MPGRQFVSSSTYRYGFNGKENDKETVNTANGTEDYGARIYNPALGRFLSRDPLANLFAWNSTYAFCENRPLDGIDLEGKEWSSSGKVFNYLTGKTEINHEIKIKTVNDKGVAAENVRVVVGMILPQVEEILGNQFAKGTIEDPVITVKVIQDKSASISVKVLNGSVIVNGKSYNGFTYSGSNTQTAKIDIGNSDAEGGMGSTLAHELGHAAGLSHPYEVPDETDKNKNPEIDIKQSKYPIQNKENIKNNLMNSSGNPDKELKGRTNRDNLTPGQRQKIENSVQSQQPKKK